LRGMHFQSAPHEEVKVVRCERGRIYDVALDLRGGSPTYLAWFAVELSPENGLSLYIPKGCAHGMQTLEDDSVVDYRISTPYSAAHSSGHRWDDPAFAITWPIPDPILSAADRARPSFRR
jgi:dTDP-4-dehydrorhamnose 3,5-epimerase